MINFGILHFVDDCNLNLSCVLYILVLFQLRYEVLPVAETSD